MFASFATKQHFLFSAPTIEDVVADAARKHLRFNVGTADCYVSRADVKSSLWHLRVRTFLGSGERDVRRGSYLVSSCVSHIHQFDEFVRVVTQKTLLKTIITFITKFQVGMKRVFIVKGGPGTAQAVIAINAFPSLTSLRMNARYFTANSAVRQLLEEKQKDVIDDDVSSFVMIELVGA